MLVFEEQLKQKLMKQTLFILTILITLAACNRDYPVHMDTAGTANNAFLKVVHVSPSFKTIFNQPDSINVFVGGSKVNGTVLTYNTAFPGVANMYSAVPAGDQTIRLSLNGVATADSITLVTLNKTLAAGSYYTLAITDSINSARDSSRIWLMDAYPSPAPGPGYCFVRLIHTVLNDTAGKTVDLYSARRNQVIVSKVPMGAATAFTAIPTQLNITDTLSVRRNGTTTVLASLPSVVLGDQRYYTLFYTGNTNLTGAKGKSLVSYIYR
jgi:hypothetical protein